MTPDTPTTPDDKPMTPRPYHRTMPGNWFMMRRNYKKFVLRELTSVFVAVYLVVFLVFLASLDTPQQFADLMSTFNSPLWWVIHAIVLLAACFHAITWFNLTPKAMPVFIGAKKAPGWIVATAMGFAPWVVLSILILWAVCP